MDWKRVEEYGAEFAVEDGALFVRNHPEEEECEVSNPCEIMDEEHVQQFCDTINALFGTKFTPSKFSGR
jgi:hypothetical protein